MAKTLKVCKMAGDNLGTVHEGFPTDMVSYRNCLIFRDKSGKVVYGDVGVCDRRDYGKSGRPIVFPCAIHWDLAWNGVRHGTQYGIEDGCYACWRYLPQDFGRELHYTQADLLFAVNEMTGADYDRVEFYDDYEAWKAADGVRELLAEHDRNDYANGANERIGKEVA